jgi:protein-disulfide isomerase
VGFGLIALAIFFSNNQAGNSQVANVTSPETTETAEDGVVPPPHSGDYIKGNPNAPIVMIEYSDYECPFCKQFHSTMNRIMDEYGATGQVAWVYRQFPITQLHPNAAKISEAALCVGDLGGNNAFWRFTDRIFETRDLDAPTNVTRLPDFAENAGVSKADYISCVSSRRLADEVVRSAEEGFNIGARGTPYTVIMVGDQQAVINGAQPYEVVKGIVVSLLEQIEGSTVPPASSN